MDSLNYNNLFRLVDDEKTFNEIGEPQNVLKTAVVMNVLMLIITFSMCFIPVPFMAPIVIILYVIAFCTSNIKYMTDFATSVYQSDNKQIQTTKAKYKNSSDKITNIKNKVDEKLEADYQKAMNVDKTVENIYSDIFGKMIQSDTLVNTAMTNKVALV
jgi:hypothetical protein